MICLDLCFASRLVPAEVLLEMLLFRSLDLSRLSIC